MNEAVSSWPVVAVDHLLAQHLPEALRDAAVDLALHDRSRARRCRRRRPPRSRRRRRHRSPDRSPPRRRGSRSGKLICGETNFATLSRPPASSSGIRRRAPAPRQLEDPDRAVGARRRGSVPSANSMSADAGLEELRRRARRPFVDGRVAGEHGGAARHHHRARGHARRARRHLVAVALHQPHRAGVDAEPLRRPDGRTWRDAPAPSPARRCAAPPCRPARSAGRRLSSRMPPATSRKQPMPMPRSLPARSEAARRAGKPSQSASASALSRIASNSPLS